MHLHVDAEVMRSSFRCKRFGGGMARGRLAVCCFAAMKSCHCPSLPGVRPTRHHLRGTRRALSPKPLALNPKP